MLIDLIPVQYRVIAAVAGAAIALGAAAAGGATINGWRLDAEHQRAMTEQKDRYDALSDKVREQNRAVELMQKDTAAADDRRKLAEQYAAGIINRIGTRTDAVNNSKATNCDGVLRDAWGNWQ